MTLKDLVQWAMRVDFGKPSRVVTGDGWKVERLWFHGPLQVERVTIAPNSEIQSHRHPNMDSWEYPISGSGVVRIRKREFVLDDVKPLPLPIPRTAWHSGKTGPLGASWLSIQEWFGDVSSVSEDWEADDNSAKVKRSD